MCINIRENIAFMSFRGYLYGHVWIQGRKLWERDWYQQIQTKSREKVLNMKINKWISIPTNYYRPQIGKQKEQWICHFYKGWGRQQYQKAKKCRSVGNLMPELIARSFYGLIPIILRHNLAKYPANGIKRQHKPTLLNIVHKYTLSETAGERESREKVYCSVYSTL